MKLRQMEVFHAIMEAGTVTGAAKVLNVSQPAVTTVLRHTEDQLRFKLFDRVHGRLEPTSEAQLLFAETSLVFDHVCTVRRTAEDLREAALGTLSIVTIPILGEYLVPQAIAAMTRERPRLRLRLQVRQRREILPLIASQAVDLGVAFLSMEHPRVEVEAIATGRMCCIVPGQHPLAGADGVRLADLATQPLVTYTTSQGLSRLIGNAFEAARIEPRTLIEVGMIANAWALVNAGGSIALVDDHSRLEELFPNVVMRPVVPEVPIALELLRTTDRPLSRMAQEFIAHLKAVRPRGAANLRLAAG